jgi:hypothetical protein
MPQGRGSQRYEWSSGAQVAVGRGANEFTVEMAIPLASLGVAAIRDGDAWRANFTRQGPASGTKRTWSPVGQDFHTRELFGTLVFGSRKAYLRGQFDQLVAASRRNAPGGDTPHDEQVGSLLSGLERSIAAEGDDAVVAVAIQQRIASASKMLASLRLKDRGYLAWRTDIWAPIAPDERVPPDAEPLTRLELVAGQNMFASAGFALSNVSGKPFMARVTTGTPQGLTPPPPQKDALDRERVELRRGAFVEQTSGRKLPDALVPLGPAGLIEVAAGETQLVWLEIDTHGLAPGRYRRPLTVYPVYAGFAPTAIELAIEVLPVDLARPRLRQWTYFENAGLTAVPGVARELVRHGMNAVYSAPDREGLFPQLDAAGNIVKVDFSPLKRKIDAMLRAVVRKQDLSFCFWLAFGIGSEHFYHRGVLQARFGSEKWKVALGAWAGGLRDFLLAEGFTYDDFVIYPVDEPFGNPGTPGTSAHMAVLSAQVLKAADPRIRVMLNPGFPVGEERWFDAYAATTDVLMPYRPHVQANAALRKALRDSGREVWTYHILHKSMPPATYRGLTWQNARDGFEGTAPFWALESHQGDALHSFDTSPGGRGLTDDYSAAFGDFAAGDLIPSRRLKAWYQGSVDFRALLACREAIRRVKATGRELADYEREVDDIIRRTPDTGAAEMELARIRLLRLAADIEAMLGGAGIRPVSADSER